MGLYLLQVIWLFLPAGCANMAAAASKCVPFLSYPIDANKTWRGNIIFGSHKTWRGLFFGFLAAIAMAYIQQTIYHTGANYYLFDYSHLNFWILGVLMASGALLGDLLRSFIKRRLHINPGTLWFPFDQVDWILGAIIFTAWYVPISLGQMIIAVLLSVLIHPLVNYVCYLIHMQKNKF